MKITVVTPVLNASWRLSQAIESLLGQSHEDWEQIIVDGGSTDDSLDIIADFAQRDSRVRLIESPGSGIYKAIFGGFAAAQGDVLSWLNADDEYTPWALAVVANRFERSDVDWLTGFPGAWDGEGRLRFLRPYGFWPQSMIRRGWFHADFLGFIQAESIFFSRSLLNQLSPDQRRGVIEAELAGDYLLWRAFAHYARLEVAPTVLGGFRLHAANRSSLERATYMREVHGSGTLRIAPAVGRRLGRAFQTVSCLAGWRAMEREDRVLQSEL